MKKPVPICFCMILVILTVSCSSHNSFSYQDLQILDSAAKNGPVVKQGFQNSSSYLNAWLELTDAETGLIPRNINDEVSKEIWNAKDCAADNYPFMVLTSKILNQEVFETKMKIMLYSEQQNTSRIGSLPDTWSFSKKGFLNQDTIMPDIIFGSAEYIKDGLIPLTEWLGPSIWSDRMISILDDIWRYAPVETPFGKIPSVDPEVNGDMLQALSRVFWFTGDIKYLEWAKRLGDYYLLGENHPTRNFKVLRLRDHGCEIVSGLCELYATVSYADKVKKESYRAPLYEMLDRILETGRNSDGLFYNSIDPVKGIPVDSAIADNFGYTLNGFYTVYLLDRIEKYREPVIKALETLNSNYRSYPWEGKSADGYADAIEGALNLYTREPLKSTQEWIDSEISVMWRKQLPSGIIEGWHGDGNFARTTIMYCLWKTGGAYISPWHPTAETGGIFSNGKLYFSVTTSELDWAGKIVPDIKRHSTYMHLPIDWPRINQFPEYFTVDANKTYKVISNMYRKPLVIEGTELIKGLPARVNKGDTVKIIIQEL